VPIRFALPFLFFLLPGASVLAQTSTFDTSSEGWTGAGDPTSQQAAHLPTGGQPNGYIRLTDAATGGIWYFVAPPKFRGNKCDAYGKTLSWDQFTSDTMNQFFSGDKPDLLLRGGNGMNLMFDNALNPQLEWTHYDVPLVETAGWRVGTVFGPAPTQAEFLAVLQDLAGLEIRGEYRSQADYGGLDNVTLPSTFHLDADANDSTTPGAGSVDFHADSLCTGPSPVVDDDAVLTADSAIDSVAVQILQVPDAGFEVLTVTGLPPGLSVAGNNTGRLVLHNDGSAAASDFKEALELVRYENSAPAPTRGVRQISIQAFIFCAARNSLAFIPLFPTGDAGRDGDTTLCAGAGGLDLRLALGPTADPQGEWSPALAAGDWFDASLDVPGTYRYIVRSAPGCPHDTAEVTVALQLPPEPMRDTVACQDSTVTLRAGAPGFTEWTWSDGQNTPAITVSEEGSYAVAVSTPFCTFRDTVEVAFFNCLPCPLYVPTAFSPNLDGLNDEFSPATPCELFRYRLHVFDRWGSLVFFTEQPETTWDGRWRGKPAPPGVYLWVMEGETELKGERAPLRRSGDVTLVR
jgi:gliding motility-associated-like protein